MTGNLPSRKVIRLPGYDYSYPGLYFVTICTHDRKDIFGNIVACVGARHASPAYMQLNRYGQLIKHIWKELPAHYSVSLDSFQIMPDHIHFVIYIRNSGEACLAPTITLGTIVGSFKSACTKQIRLMMNDSRYILWQRNYFEHIIKDEVDLKRIRYYIKQNPANWRNELNLPWRGRHWLSRWQWLHQSRAW